MDAVPAEGAHLGQRGAAYAVLGDHAVVPGDGLGYLQRPGEVDALGLALAGVVGPVHRAVGDGQEVGEDAPGIEASDEVAGLIHRR